MLAAPQYLATKQVLLQGLSTAWHDVVLIPDPASR